MPSDRIPADADVGNVARILGLFVEGLETGKVPVCAKSFSLKPDGRTSIRLHIPYTPLCYAIESDELCLVDFVLVEKSADVCGRGADDQTPLMHAIRRGNLEIVELLLRHGAGFSAHSAFFLAIEGDRVDIVEALLRDGCDPKQKILIGDVEKTPFEHAARLGKIGTIKKLLDWGVDPEPALDDLLELMRRDVDFAIWVIGRPEFEAHKSLLSEALAASRQAYQETQPKDQEGQAISHPEVEFAPGPSGAGTSSAGLADPKSSRSLPGSATSTPGSAPSPPASTTRPPGSATSPTSSATSSPGSAPSPPGAAERVTGSATSPSGSATSPPASTTRPPGSATSPTSSATSSPGSAPSPPGAAERVTGSATSPTGSATSPPVSTTRLPGSATSPTGSAPSPPSAAERVTGSATSPPSSTARPPLPTRLGLKFSPGKKKKKPRDEEGERTPLLEPNDGESSSGGSRAAPPGFATSPPVSATSPPSAATSPTGSVSSPTGTDEPRPGPSSGGKPKEKGGKSIRPKWLAFFISRRRGSAPSSPGTSGSAMSPTGSATTPTGSATTPTGSATSPTGSAMSPTGSVSSPTGTDQPRPGPSSGGKSKGLGLFTRWRRRKSRGSPASPASPPGTSGSCTSPTGTVPTRPRLSSGMSPQEQDERYSHLAMINFRGSAPGGSVQSRPRLSSGMSPQEQDQRYSDHSLMDFSGTGPGRLVEAPRTSGSATRSPSRSVRPRTSRSGTGPKNKDATTKDKKKK